ncbi:porin family protein [bacterium]|nr:porin family protein [bacterium]
MKKIFLTSLAAVMSVSAASAMELTPYVAVRGGYDHAMMNTDKLTIVEDGETYTETMGNPMGSGFMLGAAAGVSMNVHKYFNVRGELEYSYANRSLEQKYTEIDGYYDEDADEFVEEEYSGKDKYDQDAHTLMLNAYVDFKTGTPFTPYVGAGLGYSWNNLTAKDEDGDLKFDDGAFAWQVGAGVSYAATSALSIDLGYRFTDAMGLKYSKTVEDGKIEVENDTYAHQVYLGARYAF